MARRKGPGRPKIKPHARRTVLLSTRVSTREAKQLKQLARARGIKVAKLLRECGLAEVDRE